MDSRFDCETQAEVLVCATPEGVDTAVFAKPRGDGEVSLEAQRELSLRVCDGEVSVEGQRELSLSVCDAADEDFVSETSEEAERGDWRFSSLGWFFSSLSIVWTDALVEMCDGCGICDVETLFNCLPDDVEQWPGALRLLCDMFLPASKAPVLETKKHGVHVAEFYAKMLDYGAEVSKNKNKKKKGVKRKGREEEEDAAGAKRVRANTNA